MTHGSTPPGWYDDGRGGQRWWDGSQWAPEGQGPPQAGQQPPATPVYGTPVPDHAQSGGYPGYQGGQGYPGGPGYPVARVARAIPVDPVASSPAPRRPCSR